MVLDGHIHIMGDVNREALEARMAQAGVDGGIIMSRPFAGYEPMETTPFEKRLAEVLELCRGQEYRFPFLWVNPLGGRQTLEEIDEAVAQGIAGFKIISTEAMPDCPEAMEIYRHIAKREKPLLFHSGILWNEGPSSNYNRPANFECLMDVEGLRFSLAHISWPWCDECIAVYGKLCEMRQGRLEMYIDLTPGTPDIYRKEALFRLHNCGYWVEDRLVFGTDCLAEDYDAARASKMIEMDQRLYGELEIPAEIQEKSFSKNLLRFVRGAE